MALAKAIGARLILADVSTRSVWTTPYGTGSVGADREAPYSDGTTAVSKDELQLLGHLEILRQVHEAEAAGVETNAWLADRPGIRALDRLLELVQVDVLVVPPLRRPVAAGAACGRRHRLSPSSDGWSLAPDRAPGRILDDRRLNVPAADTRRIETDWLNGAGTAAACCWYRTCHTRFRTIGSPLFLNHLARPS